MKHNYIASASIGLRNAAARFRASEGGAALVEMTLITPFMLLLAAGVFEFSNIMHSKLLIETGLRDGARYIARCYHGNTLGSCQTNGVAIAANGGTGTARVPHWSVGNITVTYQTIPITVDANGLQNYRTSSSQVRIVRMSTNYAYTGTGLWDFLGFGALTLPAAHEERVVGW